MLDLIDRSMQAILEYDDEYSAHDWRSLVQMCDHKYLMRKRYQYMVQHGYAAMDDTLHEELETLEKESLIAQNMYIKYTVTDDLETIRRLRERLQAMKQKDICATKTLFLWWRPDVAVRGHIRKNIDQCRYLRFHWFEQRSNGFTVQKRG